MVDEELEDVMVAEEEDEEEEDDDLIDLVEFEDIAPPLPLLNAGNVGKSSIDMNSGSFPDATVDDPFEEPPSATSSTPSKLLLLLDILTLLSV